MELMQGVGQRAQQSHNEKGTRFHGLQFKAEVQEALTVR